MHAAQATVPLVAALLEDLKGHAKGHPVASLLPAPRVADAATNPALVKPAAPVWSTNIRTQQ